MSHEPNVDDIAKAYGDHILEAAEQGPREMRETNLRYGRTILDVAEEVGGTSERERQTNIIRRGPLWIATSLMRMEESYPGIAEYISERTVELKNSSK